MVAPAGSWPGLAWGITTSVPPGVVTGIRVPLDVTRVKPAVLVSDTVPWTGTKPGGFTALNGCPTVTIAALIVPPDPVPLENGILARELSGQVTTMITRL
jgi:hypothetical protein